MSAIAQRRVAGATALMILLYLLQVALFAQPADAAHATLAIDGNTAGADDWDSQDVAFIEAFNIVSISDPCGNGVPEDGIVQGTKLDDPDWPVNASRQVAQKGDICGVWTAWHEDSSGDTILYIAWLRDFTEGAVSVYLPLTVPPNGHAGDVLIQFDFNDNTKSIDVRTHEWDGSEWDEAANIPEVYAFSANYNFAEVSINLTDSVFQGQEGCSSFVGTSIITETGEGNAPATLFDYVGLGDGLSFNDCGTLIVEKISNGGVGTFDFTSDALPDASFQLTTETAGVAVSTPFSDLEPDTYDVAETVENLGDYWSLASATCDNGDTPDAVEVGSGETVTCTFTNSFDPPTDVSVSVTPGECVFDGEVSSTDVVVTIDPASGATVTITGPGGPYVVTGSGGTLTLSPGAYSWSAVAAEDHVLVGDASGQFTVEACPPTDVSVSVTPGECVFDGGSFTDVVVVIDPASGATVTVTGPGGPYVVTGSGGTLTLSPGAYSWSAVAAEDHVLVGDASGQFTVEACPPTDVSVSVTPGECYFDGGSFTDVVVVIDPASGATVTVTGPGGPYVVTGSGGTLTLSPGAYSWSAVAAEDHVLVGDASGQFTVDDCPPPGQATVSVAGTCSVVNGVAQYTYTVTASDGVTVDLGGGDQNVTNGGTFVSSSSSVNWTATAPQGDFFPNEQSTTSGAASVTDCTPPPTTQGTTTTTTEATTTTTTEVEVEVLGTTITTSPPEVSAETLPFTGFESGDTVKLGLLALLAGVLMLFAVRGPKEEEEIATQIGGWSSL